MPAEVLTLRQIGRATLARQMLLARERTTPLLAIARLVGMQAQWPRPPFVGLWSRVQGFARADLAKLIEARKVVRATSLRGTLHLLTAKDFVALRRTLQPVLEGGMRTILRRKGAAVDVGRVVVQARALLAEEPRTFEELREQLSRDDPGGDERAMGYAVRMLLPLVQVPDGESAWAFPTAARFALAEKWLGQKIPTEGEPQPDQLVLRYLAGYGPASVVDAQSWSGVSGLREAFEALRPRLVALRDEHGRELFDLPKAPRPPGDVAAPVRFVPEYDNLIAARADERFVARGDRPRVFLSALRIAATVLVDGFVAGTWKIERTKTTARMTIDPFAPFAARTRKEVAAEGDALLHFAEPDARAFELRFGHSSA
jgi:Winged helix DNA-binding domain